MLVAEDVEIVALVEEEDGKKGFFFDEAQFSRFGKEVAEVAVTTVGDEGDEES